ncbi:heme-binding protein [[Mycobacterium] wendilense]|uniref:Heme-binding protein n=1 Tax=[Mycobacterium] wendilense TaxID=3064284 RepID=A0ABM9MJC7_9MYCO|nr:heme-binding protein [Mycolicibacterium sp. MU0050]CAJ1586652.1 heme-binding protein [Mycolicibacterium sp. MU0050]
MNSTQRTTFRTRATMAGLAAGGLVLAGFTAPVAAAAPCMVSEAAGTISAVSGAAGQYLASHPGADQALSTARTQPREQARETVRAYFTANPGEYVELKNITAPLVDLQNRCGTAGIPSDFVSAFNEFQAG